MMKFRDMELDFDVFDAETAEVYEEAIKRVQESRAGTPKDETLSATIRRQCGRILTFLMTSLGMVSTSSSLVSAPTSRSAWTPLRSLPRW